MIVVHQPNYHCQRMIYYEDPLFDKAFLHSVNPTLDVDNIPASPALLNDVDKNIGYDSPNFSPYNVSEKYVNLAVIS